MAQTTLGLGRPWRWWFSLLGGRVEGGRPACSLDWWEFAHCQQGRGLDIVLVGVQLPGMKTRTLDKHSTDPAHPVFTSQVISMSDTVVVHEAASSPENSYLWWGACCNTSH